MVEFGSLSFVFGLAIALGYFVAVGAGVPLALLALVLERWVKPVGRAIGYVAVLPALGLLLLAVLVGSLDDPLAGVPGTVAVAVVLALVWGVPLLVGRTLLVRLTDLEPERALYHALLGLPVGLLANFLVFVAPGGFARRNILFLDGVAAVVAWGVFLVVLVFGPALVGVAAARYRENRTKAVAV